MTAFGGFGLSACGSDNDTVAETPTTPTTPTAPTKSSAVLGFESIAGSKTDAVAVAAGYSAYVLAPWGTPLNSKAAAWKADG
ncbi:hypothetical protein, partial [Psychrobacter sp. GW64-MNA-CIBAN-0177]